MGDPMLMIQCWSYMEIASHHDELVKFQVFSYAGLKYNSHFLSLQPYRVKVKIEAKHLKPNPNQACQYDLVEGNAQNFVKSANIPMIALPRLRSLDYSEVGVINGFSLHMGAVIFRTTSTWDICSLWQENILSSNYPIREFPVREDQPIPGDAADMVGLRILIADWKILS